MKYASFPTLLVCAIAIVLHSCSGSNAGDETVVDPDLHPTVLNTGELLTLDGGHRHIAFRYDGQGRVAYAEQTDTSYAGVVKQLDEYRYDADRIYITHQEFKENLDGERDYSYSRDFVRDDTLFLVNGRADSCAGAMRPISRNCFFYKFRYNDRGELTYVKNENIMRTWTGQLQEKPWYSELISYDWQDGNVCRRTLIDPINRDTTVCDYQYGELTGDFIGTSPLYFLIDFTPLVQMGYFGKTCKNLMQSVETDEVFQRNEYALDEQQRVTMMKCFVSRDEMNYATEYSIRWR